MDDLDNFGENSKNTHQRKRLIMGYFFSGGYPRVRHIEWPFPSLGRGRASVLSNHHRGWRGLTGRRLTIRETRWWAAIMKSWGCCDPDHQLFSQTYLASWWFCISRSLSRSALLSSPLNPLLAWATTWPTGLTLVTAGAPLATMGVVADTADLSLLLDIDIKCSVERWGGLTSCWLWILLGLWDRVAGADSIQCSELGVWASGP